MKKILFKALLSLRELFDPAMEGSPYEAGTITTSKPLGGHKSLFSWRRMNWR